MAQQKPPFRADHVGSFLRSATLKTARLQREKSEITPAQLKEVEDREIEKVIAKQEEIGLKLATDGEYRRLNFQDSFGHLVGRVDTFRFPAFFELNLHIERRVGFRGQWWAVRAGFNNITNHANPNVVNNIIGTPQTGALYGGQSRAFNVRLRYLGKQ